MANPVREFFVSKPEAARVVLVDTTGDIYNATGGSGGGDVNIDSVGGVPIGATVPVSGTVSVTEPVSVDDNGGSLTVDGPLTDAELRAVPVPVSISGTVSVTEPVTVDAVDLDIRNLVFATDKVDVSGSTAVGVTGPLTDTQLRATPVPVSGTVSVTEPVTVDATDLDIRNLVFATDKVDASGTVLGAGNNNIGDVDIATITAGDNTIGRVKITDGTDLALVTAAGNLNVVALAQPGTDIGDVTINNATGASAVNIQDGGNSITVDGTVTAAAQPGVDIGDVTVNNAAGASAVNIQDGGNSITVDGTVTVGSITAGDNVIGRVKVTDGTDVALVTAAGEQNVIATAQPGVDIGDVTINNAAGASAVNIQDGGNTITVDGTVTAAQATASSLNAQVVGVAAHDAAVSGNPVLVAASSETMADSAPANRTTADAEVMRFSATDGAQYVITTGPQTWSYHENSSSALTDQQVHASAGAGLSLYVTDIVFSSGAATAINIFFEEGSTTVLGPWYLEATAGRGLAIHFGTPKKITAATALTVTTSAAIAHGLDVLGFVAPG